MAEFKIIDPPGHFCGKMIRILRSEHKDVLDRFGLNAHRELKSMFDSSAFRRAWVIDGELAALGGVSGSPLETASYVWVAFSQLARKYPVQLIKEARKQLRIVMATRKELVTTVLPEDEAAMRLAVFMGFHCAHTGRGQPALSKFSRRDLVSFIKENILAGRIFVI